MNCSEVKERMADLFDAEVGLDVKEELLAHFESCPDCKKTYDEWSRVVAELRPGVLAETGKDFRSKVAKAILLEGNAKRNRILPNVPRVWKRIAAVAAVLILAVLIVPILNWTSSPGGSAKAAVTILQKSIDAMTAVKTVQMDFQVRTREGDNFEYINTGEQFVEHHLWKVYGNPSKWKIEKPGRTVVMDGASQYLYIYPVTEALKASPDAGFVEWMRILLDPENILEKEKDNARKNGSKFKIEMTEKNITLTINAKAMGEYTNSYLLNTSIPESDNRRVYSFDKTSNLLSSLEVYVDSFGKEIKMLDLSTIRYNEPIEDSKFTIQLPEGVSWVTPKEIQQTGADVKTSRDAARLFFTACQKEDWATVRTLIPGFLNFLELQFAVKKQYGGLEILSIGKPFKSGLYPGEFVPYEVKCKNGYVKRWNLAVRNDNPGKKWVLDGGY